MLEFYTKDNLTLKQVGLWIFAVGCSANNSLHMKQSPKLEIIENLEEQNEQRLIHELSGLELFNKSIAYTVPVGSGMQGPSTSSHQPYHLCNYYQHYQCEESGCTYTTKYLNAYTNHRIENHNGRCGIRGCNTTLKYNDQIHDNRNGSINAHHSKKHGEVCPYRCESCGQGYLKIGYLRNHKCLDFTKQAYLPTPQPISPISTRPIQQAAVEIGDIHKMENMIIEDREQFQQVLNYQMQRQTHAFQQLKQSIREEAEEMECISALERIMIDEERDHKQLIEHCTARKMDILGQIKQQRMHQGIQPNRGKALLLALGLAQINEDIPGTSSSMLGLSGQTMTRTMLCMKCKIDFDSQQEHDAHMEAFH